MSQIQGPGPNPEDQAIYKQQFNQGLTLFKNALEQYHNADEAHKKAAFADVMGKALNVLN